jgi:predicted MFS family arabinose efflux permease
MRIFALVMLLLLILANLAVKSNVPPKPRRVALVQYLGPFRDINFAILEIATFAFSTAMFIPSTYIVVSALSFGMAPTTALYLVVMLNGTG